MAAAAADEANKQLIDQRKLSLIGDGAMMTRASATGVAPVTCAEETSESSSISYYMHPRPISGPKILLKFIDSSVDSDLPPSLSRLRQASLSGGGCNELRPLTVGDRKLSSVSISRNVEYFDDVPAAASDGAEEVELNNGCDHDGGDGALTPRNGGSFRRKRRRSDVVVMTTAAKEFDSAVEMSTSSSDNNQVSLAQRTVAFTNNSVLKLLDTNK